MTKERPLNRAAFLISDDGLCSALCLSRFKRDLEQVPAEQAEGDHHLLAAGGCRFEDRSFDETETRIFEQGGYILEPPGEKVTLALHVLSHVLKCPVCD